MEFKHEELIEREIEIAAYLLQNFSVRQIANQLTVSKKIIEAHIRNMMRKLNVANMKDLIKLLNKLQQN